MDELIKFVYYEYFLVDGCWHEFMDRLELLGDIDDYYEFVDEYKINWENY